MLQGKFIAFNAYVKKQERSQIYNPIVHLRTLEKGDQTKPKASRGKEVIKIRVEIDEIKGRKTRKNQWNKKWILWKDQQNWTNFYLDWPRKRERHHLNRTEDKKLPNNFNRCRNIFGKIQNPSTIKEN